MMMMMISQARHSNRFRVSVNTEAHNLVQFFLVSIRMNGKVFTEQFLSVKVIHHSSVK